jgi:hypothetical protein
MRLYVVESDRQVRVYGLAAGYHGDDGGGSTPRLLNQDSFHESGPQQQQQPGNGSCQPRGLAAIPLLCAAALETRQAYLIRLAHTERSQAWWARQEPLCATPGTIWALPESILLAVAALVEMISFAVDTPAAPLASADGRPQPPPSSVIPCPSVIQSFLWPLHNTLLSLWMGVILDYTLLQSCIELMQTLLWGSRRTGLSLETIWRDEIQWSVTQVNVMTESHQPLTARLVGLACLPFTLLVGLVNAVAPPAQVPASVLFVSAVAMTWWYWCLVLPFLSSVLIFFSLIAGGNFALIELAGV